MTEFLTKEFSDRKGAFEDETVLHLHRLCIHDRYFHPRDEALQRQLLQESSSSS